MKHIKNRDNFINENITNGLTIHEICDGVISGKIKVDMKGHNRLGDKITGKEYFKKALKQINDLMSQPRKKEMQEYYDGFIKNEFVPGENLNRLISLPELYCWDCDKRLIPILKSYNEVSFIDLSDYFTIAGPFTKDGLKPIDPNKIPKCELDKDITDRIITEINLPSGDLVIANFFKEKEIYDVPNGDSSINSLLGRIKLAEYLSKLDVGYGQMGNMSIEVWKKEDGTEVLFTGSYDYDEDTGEESEFEYDGFKHLGSISLSVWRWMCADIKTLKKHNEKLPKLIEDGCVEDEYRDFILAKVKPGKWVIEHYYDIEERKDGIYSKLYLK